ncbi:hypothetical protein [Schleiferilactobacillus shenzhenensis]|uniref:Uncharacterized protein n=1 Tax=Schleiferilactobacillus shenzhenensis LY-73 TaxID=1231336 RepID=U4TGF0_9LACO|nr:hypothetical protein [Schleiferilactobacillus shenzhenensis]ERL63826.1 hypothetical protein L248_2119 [Schleiferilactobacillus shenzhenensis LY-73]
MQINASNYTLAAAYDRQNDDSGVIVDVLGNNVYPGERVWTFRYHASSGKEEAAVLSYDVDSDKEFFRREIRRLGPVQYLRRVMHEEPAGFLLREFGAKNQIINPDIIRNMIERAMGVGDIERVLQFDFEGTLENYLDHMEDTDQAPMELYYDASHYTYGEE